MVLTTLVRNTVPRIPLIRFRKGGYSYGSGVTTSSTENQASAVNTKVSQHAGVAIEDWELPPRYWRKPIDPVEMEYINRGGPN